MPEIKSKGYEKMTAANLYGNIPDELPDELFQEILNLDNVRIERIVSRGHRSPEGFWYDQAWDEWVLVMGGRAGLEMEENTTVLELGPGDHLLIPAHTRHRVAWTEDGSDTIWLAVHIHSRENL
jgi:cupin 2 domain-containing protein